MALANLQRGEAAKAVAQLGLVQAASGWLAHAVPVYCYASKQLAAPVCHRSG